VNPSKLLAKSLLLLPLAALSAQSQPRVEQIKEAGAERTLDVDLDLDDILAMAQDQLEMAQSQVSDSVEEGRNLAQKDIEEARKQASQQMAKARKQMDDARRQWQKQIEEARKQMQLAAKSIRAVARQEQLMSVYPRIGILVKPNGAGAGRGTVVQGVTPGSPAEKAGIKAGDVIVAVDGQRLQDSADGGADEDSTSRILKLLRRTKPGQQIEVQYRRGSESRKTAVLVESRHASGGYAFHDGHRTVRVVELPGGWLELELAAINPELGEYFGTPRGLLVLHSSNAGDVKLKPGDVILKIGEEEPSTPTQAVRLLRSYEPGQSIPVEVLRQKKKQMLALQIPRAGSDKQ
jgi:S1-C subfamily serine protease